MGTIHDRILARRDLDALRVAKDLDGLAAALNAEGLTSLQTRYITMRTISAEFSPADARLIIAAVSAASAADVLASEAIGFLRKDSGFDIADPGTQAYIDEMVTSGALSAELGERFKAMGLAPLRVDRLEVEADLFEPDGTEKTA